MPQHESPQVSSRPRPLASWNGLIELWGTKRRCSAWQSPSASDTQTGCFILILRCDGEHNKYHFIPVALVESISVGGEEGYLCFLYHNWDGEADLSEGSFLAVASQKPVVTEIHMKINYWRMKHRDCSALLNIPLSLSARNINYKIENKSVQFYSKSFGYFWECVQESQTKWLYKRV